MAAPLPWPKLLLDSGASFHMVGDARLLSNLRDAPPRKTVTVANGNVLPVTKIGDIQMPTAGFTIPGVHLVPGLTMDLISVRELTRQSRICTWFDGDGRAMLYAGPDLVGVAVAAPHGNYGLYVLQYLKVPNVAAGSSDNRLDGEMKLVWRRFSARTWRPVEQEVPSAATVPFPPSFALANLQTFLHGHFHGYLHSQSLQPTPKKKGKCVNSSSAASKSEISSKKRGKYGDSNSGPSNRSTSGSNQPEPFPINVNAKRIVNAKQKVKAKAKNNEAARGGAKNVTVPFDCPAMATRSKVAALASPGVAT